MNIIIHSALDHAKVLNVNHCLNFVISFVYYGGIKYTSDNWGSGVER